MRNTTVGNPSGVHVQTIEHLMAALFIAGIDSAVIDIDGPETPILDGSAAVFFNSFAYFLNIHFDLIDLIINLIFPYIYLLIFDTDMNCLRRRLYR